MHLHLLADISTKRGFRSPSPSPPSFFLSLCPPSLSLSFSFLFHFFSVDTKISILESREQFARTIIYLMLEPPLYLTKQDPLEAEKSFYSFLCSFIIFLLYVAKTFGALLELPQQLSALKSTFPPKPWVSSVEKFYD